VEEQTDKTVIKNMSIFIVILIVIAFSVAFIARDVGFKDSQEKSAGSAVIIEKRIKPVAGAYTQENGPVAAEETVAETTPTESVSEQAVAETTPTESVPEQAAAPASAPDLDYGKKIYNTVCFACHETGVANAPKPGSEVMTQRAEKGLDALVKTAVDGLNAMPPRGGRADLSDEQIRAVVEFMLQ